MIVNQIQGGRWDTLLRRLLPIKDRSIAPIMASELVGQVVVQEWEPELFALRNEHLAIGQAAGGAVAAEFSHCKLRNPVDSGTLLILEEIWVRTSANLIVELAQVSGVATVGFTDQVTAFRDLRLGGTPLAGTTVGQVSRDTSVALAGGTGTGRFAVLTADSKMLKLVQVLPPNSELIIRGLTVNVALQCTFLWRERGAEPSELLF